MKEYNEEILDYFRNNNKARLNLIKYIKLSRIKSGKKKLNSIFNNVNEYEFDLRYKAFLLSSTGDYLNYLHDKKKNNEHDYLEYMDYVDNIIDKEMEKQKSLKLTK